MRIFFLLLAPQVGSTAPRASLCSVAPLHTPLRWGVAFYGRPRPNQQPFRLLVATYRLMVTPEIQSPGCSRPNTNKVKKRRYAFAYLLSFTGSPSWTRTNDIVINSHALYRLSYWGIYKSQHLPIFPGRFHPSIFGTTQFNFCVRHGNRWDLSAIGTG